MAYFVTSQTGAGSSTPIVVDHELTSGINIGFGAEKSGTVTDYGIEHTFDEDATDAGATWWPHESLTGQNTEQDGNYAYGISGIRVTIVTGTGTITLKIIQAGSRLQGKRSYAI